jgi:hypothetical protein
MSEYVYAASDGLVQNNLNGGTVFLQPGDVWFADDPFVLHRPELFSRTPLRVNSTQGREAPPATRLDAEASERRPHARAKRA